MCWCFRLNKKTMNQWSLSCCRIYGASELRCAERQAGSVHWVNKQETLLISHAAAEELINFTCWHTHTHTYTHSHSHVRCCQCIRIKTSPVGHCCICGRWVLWAEAVVRDRTPEWDTLICTQLTGNPPVWLGYRPLWMVLSCPSFLTVL